MGNKQSCKDKSLKKKSQNQSSQLSKEEREKKLAKDLKQRLQQINSQMGQMMNVKIENEPYRVFLNETYDCAIQFLKWEYEQYQKISKQYMQNASLDNPNIILRISTAHSLLFGETTIQALFTNSKIKDSHCPEERQKLHIFYHISVLESYYKMNNIQLSSSINESQLSTSELSSTHKSKEGIVEEAKKTNALTNNEQISSQCIIVDENENELMDLKIRKQTSHSKANLARQVSSIILNEKIFPIGKMVRHFDAVLRQQFIKPFMKMSSDSENLHDVFCAEMSKAEAEFIVFASKAIVSLVVFIVKRLLSAVILPKIQSNMFGSNQELFQELFCGEIAEKLIFNSRSKCLLNSALFVLYEQTNCQKELNLELFDEDLSEFIEYQSTLKKNQKTENQNEQTYQNNIFDKTLLIEQKGKTTPPKNNFNLSEENGIMSTSQISFIVDCGQGKLKSKKNSRDEVSGIQRTVSKVTEEELKKEKEEVIRSNTEFKLQLSNRFGDYFLQIFNLLDECINKQSIFKQIKAAYKLIVKLQQSFVQTSFNANKSVLFIESPENYFPLIESILKGYLILKPNRRFDLYKLSLVIEFVQEENRNCNYAGILQGILFKVLKIDEEQDENDEEERTLEEHKIKEEHTQYDDNRVSILSLKPMAPLQQKSEIVNLQPYHPFPGEADTFSMIGSTIDFSMIQENQTHNQK